MCISRDTDNVSDEPQPTPPSQTPPQAAGPQDPNLEPGPQATLPGSPPLTLTLALPGPTRSLPPAGMWTGQGRAGQASHSSPAPPPSTAPCRGMWWGVQPYQNRGWILFPHQNAMMAMPTGGSALPTHWIRSMAQRWGVTVGLAGQEGGFKSCMRGCALPAPSPEPCRQDCTQEAQLL